jgi:hypothetical protein
MTPAEQYRVRAAELIAKARAETNCLGAAQWEHLAKCYVRLAEQADQNSLTDLAIEVGPKPKLGGEIE